MLGRCKTFSDSHSFLVYYLEENWSKICYSICKESVCGVDETNLEERDLEGNT